MKKYLIILIFILGNEGFSQHNVDKKDISNILNDLFKNEEFVYQNYLDFKGLKIFIDQPLILDQLYGQPCILDNSVVHFEELIDKEESFFLSDQISMFERQRIDANLLNKNIKLVDNEDHKNIIWITKPLVFNNKAIVYLKRNNEESIVVLKKNTEKKWIMICQKYLYLSIDN